MIRLIRRYESRKLYDTEESRYVSLEEVGEFVRRGQEVQVVDNASGEDVTAHTLAQIILGDGRTGRPALSADFLHDLVRRGERVLSSGVEQVQHGVDRLVQASIEKVGPLRQAREEMEMLRDRLERLESSLEHLEEGGIEVASPSRKPRAKKATRKKVTHKKAARKKAAGKTVRRKATKKAAGATRNRKTAGRRKTTRKKAARKAASK